MRVYGYCKPRVGAWIAGALLLVAAPSLRAQQAGTVAGEVVESGSMRPISGAQIYVVGREIGSLSNAEGRFLIPGVPAGEHTLRVEVIGYATQDHVVTVQAGQTATVRFELENAAVDLDEIIVTGTPGATRRRAIGTSVASVDVEKKLADVPITSVSDLLTGREAGMVSMGGNGAVGTMGTITLRGMTSMSQNNKPLIYVDGIRLDTNDDPLIYVGGQQTSRLNDISPADIARVEIIKGAAATTLYGSEASNGVIQIFTKKGQTGKMTFNGSVRAGINRLPAAWPKMNPDPKYPDPNKELIKNGLYQEYSLSARGGSQNISYFASGNLMDSEGSFPQNQFNRMNGRLNLGMALGDFVVDISSAAMYTNVELPVNDNVIDGILTNIQLGNPVTQATATDPWGGAFYPVPYLLTYVTTEKTYRWVGGVTINHTVSDAFQHKLTVGVDLANGEGISFDPYAEGEYITNRQLKGSKNVSRRSNVQTNVDYTATWTAPVTQTIQSHLSVGGQLFTTTQRRVSASGSEFPSPGLSVVGAAALPGVGESEVSYATGGLFVQEQLGFSDRFFLTGGLRVDGSSVFGDDFGFQPYPKVAMSWVISEEKWFSMPAVSSLRLRGGFGSAGTQPGAFDAVRTYVPRQAAGGKTGFRPGNSGNPDLAPEVSQELEFGFDAGLFDERLSLTASGYYQKTTDALLSRQNIPSLGFTGTQLTNVGEMRNKGIEIDASWTLIDNGALRWSLNSTYAYNDNKITSLPGTSYISLDRFGTRVVEGYSMSSKWERKVAGYDEDGMPFPTDTAVYLGPGIPPHNGTFGTEVNWSSFRLAVNTQWAAGYIMSNLLRPYMYARRTGEEYFTDLAAAGGQEDTYVEAKQRMASCCYGNWYDHGDYVKLREVSLSWTAPEGFVGGLLGSAPRFFVTGHNLATFTGYSGVDPELSGADDSYDGKGLSVSSDYFTVPPVRTFVFGMDIVF